MSACLHRFHFPYLPPLPKRYLYSTGFKAASKVTDAGKEALRARLPPFATPAFHHALSRYLKTP